MGLGLNLILFVALFLPAPVRAEEVFADNLKEGLALLASTPRGAAQLEAAKLAHVAIQLGPVSRTDITATRARVKGQEVLTYETRIILSGKKSPLFQALDLTHELTHALHPKLNPFDASLSLTAYVQDGIESPGGEAQAIFAECEFARDVLKDKSKLRISDESARELRDRCEFVWQNKDKPRDWNQSFYELGEHYDAFQKKLAELPLGDAEKKAWLIRVGPGGVHFASAVAHRPYPLALLEEYVDITRKICEKSKKNHQGRQPARADPLVNRCEAVGVQLVP